MFASEVFSGAVEETCLYLITPSYHGTQPYKPHYQVRFIFKWKKRSSRSILRGYWRNYPNYLHLAIFDSYSDLPAHERIRRVFSETLTELERINVDYGNLLRGRRWEKLSVDEMIQKKRPQHWSASQFYKIQNLATEEFITILWEKELDCRKVQQSTGASPDLVDGKPLQTNSTGERQPHSDDPLPDHYSAGSRPGHRPEPRKQSIGAWL